MPGTEADWKQTGRNKLHARAERLRLEFGEAEFSAEATLEAFNVSTVATARKYLNELAEHHLVKRRVGQREPGARGQAPVLWKVAPPLVPEWTLEGWS